MGRISTSLVFVLTYLSSASTHHRRLARDVTPTHYYITWAINECEFSGKVAIDIDVKNETDHFKLHARDLQINQETIKLEKLPSENVDVVSLDGVKAGERFEYVIGGDSGRNLSVNAVRGERLKVSLSEPLEIGSKYRLRMEFNGTLNSRKTYGFFCQRYRQNNQTKWLASATFEPKHARSAFPCFDEPGLKANFTISIAHEKKLIALSNMPLNTSVPSDLGENWVLDTFQTTPKMSTYLVGLLVSEYEKIETKLNEKPIRIWAHSNKVEYGDLPLRMATRHLSYLQNYTGIEDPMPKQDFLAIKNYVAGGLENWGLISYEEHLILFNPRYRRQKQVVYRACNLIGHELAHIYFGNLVSVDSWRDIWLNEGFATYYAALSTEQVYRGYGTQAWIVARESAMVKDSKPTSHALRPKTHTDHIFDEISYNKGSSILRMLNFTLGEAVLKEGIRNYLHERIYSTASHKSLWENLEKAALKSGVVFPEGVNLEQIMDSWMNVPGYPLVTVSRDYETGEITLTQRSILNKENEIEESESTGWFIPLSYTYQGENKTVLAPRLWLDPRQPNLTIQDPAPSDRWILFNLQGSAYTRVRYDGKNAEFLTQDLSDLWIEDRVQVVSDMLELARLGFSPIEGSLNVMSLFKNEISPFPWLAFLSSATKTQSFLESTELESLYVEFLNTILSAGMERVTEESPHRKELVTLSCKLGVEQCTVMGREMFKKWAEDPQNEIPEDIRYAVLCLGVSEGDAKTWKLVHNRLSKVEEMSEKKDILKALACTKDEKIMLEYLKYGLTTNKTSNPGKKISVILKSLAKQHPDFVLDQLIERKAPTPKHNGRWQRLLEVLADQVNSPKRLEKLQKLVAGSSDSYKSAGKTIPVMAIAEKNVAWMKNNKKSVESWLRNHEVQRNIKI